MPFPSNPNVGDHHQPNAPTGPDYIYRGNGKWDIFLTTSTADFINYYTKSESDAINSAQDANTSSSDAAVQLYSINRSNHIGDQPVSSINGLQAALDGKASSAHSHVIADVTNLQAALDGKASSAHSHVIADITNLQAALDGKQPINSNLNAWSSILPSEKLNSSSYTASDVLAKLLTVDGPSSGIDADTVDGINGANIVRTVNGSGPDGSGNVTISLSSFIQDVRLGAETTYEVVGGYTAPSALSGYVITKQILLDQYSSPASGLQRPIQKNVNGTWITVSQVAGGPGG